MQKKKFLSLLEEILELNPNSIIGGEKLSDLAKWDSVSVLAFMAMVDEQFGKTLPAAKIAQAKTVEDLISLLENSISD